MPAGSLFFPQASLALLSLLRRCGVAVHKPETMKRAPWVYDVSRVTS